MSAASWWLAALIAGGALCVPAVKTESELRPLGPQGELASFDFTLRDGRGDKVDRTEILLLIPSAWHRFHQRRLLRFALQACRSSESLRWFFLMGAAPHSLLRRAVAEAAAEDDMLLLQRRDSDGAMPWGQAIFSMMVLALRHLLESQRPKFVMLSDDESFVSIPNLHRLVAGLPTEGVYAGSRTSALPARPKSMRPLFTNTTGFLVSLDVAEIISETALQTEGDGPGADLTAIRKLRFVPWAELILGHGEEGRAGIEGSCSTREVVVRPMTPGRWQHFDSGTCRVCTGRSRAAALPAPRQGFPEPRPSSGDGSGCVPAADLGCRWQGHESWDRRMSAETCRQRCQAEGLWSSNRTSWASPTSPQTSRCPLALCFALCQPPGPSNTLCPTTPWDAHHAPTPRLRRPRLVLSVYGSEWTEAAAVLRSGLRRALGGCKGGLFGIRSVDHLFVMGELPRDGGPRRDAIREMLRFGDLVLSRPCRSSSCSSDRSYAYADAWSLVEEQLGGSDYIVLLDHRAYVNLPMLMHFVLPSLPRSLVYAGSFIGQSLFRSCTDSGESWCSYLQQRQARREAPMFAHGMGFLVSADVAHFAAGRARSAEEAELQLPPDVAYGAWLRPMKGLQYQNVTDFHHFPGERLSSTILFPMDWWRWQEWFRLDTCELRASRQTPLEAPPIFDDEPRGATRAVLVDDCWLGMEGRPEASYLVCCELNWPLCWDVVYTRERCCPPPFPPETSARQSGGAAEALRSLLRFSGPEFDLLIQAFRALPGEARGLTWSKCLSPADCAQEAFVRLYHSFWQARLLPLRDAWLIAPDDRLVGMAAKLQRDTGTEGLEEHIVDRKQITSWMQEAAALITPANISGERRCLEWEEPKYSKRFFREHCNYFDVVNFANPGDEKVISNQLGKAYYLDIHKADEVIEPQVVQLVICTQVFEHVRYPYKAMEQIFRMLSPGGFLVWSAPTFSQIHRVPHDYFRYTPEGAAALAEDAGFEVVREKSPGDLKSLIGIFLGMITPYWTEQEMLSDVQSAYPLQVYLLLQRPVA